MPRRVGRAGLVALGAALALAGCGGGGDDREAVRSYISAANRIQLDGTADLDAANAAYTRFSRGRQLGPAAVERLRDTVDRLRATREHLARLDAPAQAAALRRRLLAVFDRNIALAGEAALLAAYIPAASSAMAALPRYGKALRRGLAGTGAAVKQRALTTYARCLSGLERRMRALSPPPVLLAAHRSQLLRIDTARTLARRIRDAVERNDGPAVARLLLRFRDVYTSSLLDRAVQRAAFRAYRRRLLGITTAVGALQREEQRLQRSLG
jgi:hypothetical protein